LQAFEADSTKITSLVGKEHQRYWGSLYAKFLRIGEDGNPKNIHCLEIEIALASFANQRHVDHCKTD
jgi:hypothetical protein